MAERKSAGDGYDVVGIGNAIVDIIARCDDAFLSKHDLAKGFMRLIPAGEAGRLYEAMGPAIERSAHASRGVLTLRLAAVRQHRCLAARRGPWPV